MKRCFFAIIIFLVCPLLSSDNVVDIVVIGSGPAGMSASIYLSRAKINHVVIEGDFPGGQLTKAASIQNWPGKEETQGSVLADKLRAQTVALGTKYISGAVKSLNLNATPFEIFIKKEDGSTEKFITKTIVIATGTSPKNLNIKGEEEYLGSGIALCANCDAPLFENKKVIVIGGGYEALREIGIISKYTQDITIINTGKELCGPKMLLNFLTPDMNILHDVKILEIMGNGEKSTGVKIKHNSSGDVETIKADGIFIASGWEPNTKIFEGKLKLNDKKEIVTNKTKTSIPGVFAGGDVTSESYHQAPIAAAQGYQAAMEAEKYLFNQTDNNCRNVR